MVFISSIEIPELRIIIHMKIILDIEMAKRNLSVRQVSRMTGIPASTISDIMNGRSMPRMDTMELLAKGLHTRISDRYESPYK